MLRRRLLLMMQQAQVVWRTVVKTGTGLIIANDTTEGQPVDIQLQGWTTQEGEPSSEYPQEIVNAGKYNEETQKYEVEVEVRGSNIFNKNGEYVSGTYVGFPINNREEEVTVTLYEKDSSIDVTNVYFGVSGNGVNTSGGVGWIISNGTVVTKYKKTNFGYITFYPKSAVEKVLSRYDIMVNFGDKSLPYQEYMEQTITVTSDRPITKWDRLVEKDGVIGWEYNSKIENNPSITQKLTDDVRPEGTFHRYDTNMPSVYPYDGYKCNVLVYDSKDDVFFAIVASGKILLYFRKETNINTIDLASEWLSSIKDSTGIEFVFRSKAQEFVPLLSEEQETFKSLKTYYPTTVFSNNDDMFMQVEYKTKYGNVVYIDSGFIDGTSTIDLAPIDNPTYPDAFSTTSIPIEVGDKIECQTDITTSFQRTRFYTSEEKYNKTGYSFNFTNEVIVRKYVRFLSLINGNLTKITVTHSDGTKTEYDVVDRR